MKKQRKPPTALILVSCGFEEESTIQCMTQLRGLGTEAKLVGLTSGLLVGARGLTIRPDISLAELDPRKVYRLIVVPGFSQNTRLLLADPRVHQLFTATAERGGLVALMKTAEDTFFQTGLFNSLALDSIITQGEQESSIFLHKLVRLATE